MCMPDQAAASEPCEVFEDWGCACEALLVQGSGQVPEAALHCLRLPHTARMLTWTVCLLHSYIAGSCAAAWGMPSEVGHGRAQGRCFCLCEARVLAQPGGDALLEMAGQASLLYVVRDEAGPRQRRCGWGAAAAVARQPDSAAERLSAAALHEEASPLAPAPSSCESGEQGCGLAAEDDSHCGPWAAMDPGTEEGVCMHIVHACHAFLAGAPTSAAEDAALLQALQAGHQAQPDDQSCSTAGRAQARRNRRWQARCHARMALQYRLQRKLLLRSVAEDLAAQACMLSP